MLANNNKEIFHAENPVVNDRVFCTLVWQPDRSGEHGAGVGDCHKSDDNRVDNAGKIGVLCALVDHAGNDCGAEENQDDREEPQDEHRVVRVGHGLLHPHHVAGIVVGDVLDPGEDQGGRRGKYAADDAVGLAADDVVVETVRRNGDGNVVGKEQQHIGQIAKDRVFKGLDGQCSETEVCKEEVIFNKDNGVGDCHYDNSEQGRQTQLLQWHLHAAVGEIESVLLAVGISVFGPVLVNKTGNIVSPAWHA